MKIHSIKLRTDASSTIISAGVHCAHRDSGFPEQLRYTFSGKGSDRVVASPNAFLVALLPAAMSLGEDLHVAGAVSRKLLYNLREYQRILHFWRPETFSMIRIVPAGIAEPQSQDRHGALASFSGGMDSSYTVYAHLPGRVAPVDAITHCFFLKGFDTKEDARTQQIKCDSFQELLASHAIAFTSVDSNIRDFYRGRRMPMRYGAIIAGTALFFETVLSRFYFSEDHTYDHPRPFGLNHLLVPLLSTENMAIKSFGGHASKVAKARVLSQWPATYDRLVVCHERPHGLHNCGVCTKCCMSMAALAMAGVLDRYSTFPPKLDRRALRRGRFIKEHWCFPSRFAAMAWEEGHYALWFDYRVVLLLSYVEHAAQYAPRWSRGALHVLLHPVAFLYRISHMLKQRVPLYARLLTYLKGPASTN